VKSIGLESSSAIELLGSGDYGNRLGKSALNADRQQSILMTHKMIESLTRIVCFSSTREMIQPLSIQSEISSLVETLIAVTLRLVAREREGLNLGRVVESESLLETGRSDVG